MHTFAKKLWPAFAGLFLLYFLSRWEQLPATFPTHFDLSGNANGWSSKDSFLDSFLGLFAFANLILLVVYGWLEKIPLDFINLPNKDYWFATPARTVIGYEKLRGILALVGAFCNFAFFLCIHVVFLESHVVQTPLIPMAALVPFFGLTLLGFIGLTFLITRRSKQ